MKIGKEKNKTRSVSMKSDTILVTGMHCASCAHTIEKNIAKENGVLNTSVSYSAGRASVEYNPGKTDEKKIVGVVNKLGHKRKR